MQRTLCIVVLAAVVALVSGCEVARYERAIGSAKGGPAPTAAAASEGGGAARDAGGGYRRDIQSGTLTAGSFDDAAEPEPYHTFVSKLTDGTPLAQLASKCVGRPLVLIVRDGEGRPLGGAEVLVRAAEGDRAVKLVSRTDGRVVIHPTWDGFEGAKTLSVAVTAPGGQKADASVPVSPSPQVLTVAGAAGALPKQLDLAFVLDCTGSMSDELEYLKVELKGIVEAVAARFPQVKQRYALVAYRDVGDQYVTRTFEFTDSLGEFRKRLGRQSAGGGGDYPEAVDQALDQAAQLRWSGGNAARVAFHVADAPPHNELAGKALAALDALRRQGVAVYPVASSGVGNEAEFIMRTEALLTGAAYLFLTDDSGVGNPHAKPHFPHYHVEKLSQLMVRMIASELAGRRIDPEPKDILRTVEHQDPDEPQDAPDEPQGETEPGAARPDAPGAAR